MVTKNPQGEGGEKGDFFGCCLTEKRCKVVIVPREERRRLEEEEEEEGTHIDLCRVV